MESDDACGVIRGEVGGVMSNMRLEDDWVGLARPYVTGGLSLADPSQSLEHSLTSTCLQALLQAQYKHKH
jgi:hypothetical protein